jgi:hypothetical protein
MEIAAYNYLKIDIIMSRVLILVLMEIAAFL